MGWSWVSRRCSIARSFLGAGHLRAGDGPSPTKGLQLSGGELDAEPWRLPRPNSQLRLILWAGRPAVAHTGRASQGEALSSPSEGEARKTGEWACIPFMAQNTTAGFQYVGTGVRRGQGKV